jgi:catechol 2,3-dioxygenase-like lactoylglutathione lyase family enzyme
MTAMLARRLAPVLALLALLVAEWSGAAPSGAPAPARPAPAAPLVEGVEAVAITVSDLDRAVDFYARVLLFEKVSEVELLGAPWERLLGVFGANVRVARMRLGRETIELVEYLTPRGRVVPADSRSNDRWFQHVAIIVRDMDRAYRWLRRHKVEHASTAPQRLPDWNPHAGGIRAFYFKDPDGHPLEILQFPPGKGDPRWQAPSDRLFLGIDHTAIVVADTAASLAFYRDTLGLRVAGESENWGEEQERLNSVFGARLRITSLRGSAGPAVEFLEYLAPRDGRALPADARTNDLLAWQTIFWTRDAQAAVAPLRSRRFAFVSPEAVAVDPERLGFRQGLIVRDPDGHLAQLRAR